ncbi:hypothetical protein CXB51_037014 [Gossypium anomalum]|uniref:Uncharacterized protein n=1 Tax=Gossypium anomalum TaxID=47600 RepID=A0A8J5XV33_9ROSI|nr:hypothetical protein CXB51_037014 [Gossypium anomalum]
MEAEMMKNTIRERTNIKNEADAKSRRQQIRVQSMAVVSYCHNHNSETTSAYMVPLAKAKALAIRNHIHNGSHRIWLSKSLKLSQ